ncbi:MAG: hypothetical protein PHQ53_11255, partial [Candidatus Krumholzibacteria bacterium]|nr:hypothetical protein [Candidatus Krumholzibacteria bacterium]
MSQQLWYSLADERLVTDLADLLNVPETERRELRRRLDPDLLRESGRRRGWLVEVRAADPETFVARRRAGDLSLLVAGERALLLRRSDRELALQLPGGGRRRVPAERVFEQLGDEAVEERSRRRAAWCRLGVARRSSDRAEAQLGPARAARILDWLERHPWCDAGGVLEFARRTP